MQLNSHRVLILVDSVKQQDSDGIFMQEEWQSREPVGTVVAVADDVRFCKAGDRVFFDRYSAVSVPDNEDWRMCLEDAVHGIYNA